MRRFRIPVLFVLQAQQPGRELEIDQQRHGIHHCGDEGAGHHRRVRTQPLGQDGQQANRYLFWTSLNTDKVGIGKKIPVIIQTGDGKYYVSETTTGQRKDKTYVTISKSLTPSQYKQTLKNGEQFSSLEAAYDAYLNALSDSKYDSVRKP